MPNLDAWSPRVLSVLRIVVALLFMEHGLMKLFHFPGPQAGAPDPLAWDEKRSEERCSCSIFLIGRRQKNSVSARVLCCIKR